MFGFMKKNSAAKISVFELPPLLGKIDLIDIREVSEYKGGHVPTAKNIPASKLVQSPDSYLDKEKEYYIICQSGGRSGQATSILSQAGYKVIDVTGGTGRFPGQLQR